MRRKQLYLRLLALSLAGDDQIAILPKGIRSPDVFAEDLDTELHRIETFGPNDLSPDQLKFAREVDKLLEVMTDTGDTSLWDPEALHIKPEWQAVRERARAALNAGDWPETDPNELQMAFGEPENERAYQEVISRLRSKLKVDS